MEVTINMSSNDREIIPIADTCHVFVAIARKKDNPNMIGSKHVHRRIIRDYDTDLNVLRSICKTENLTYRIYKTVNKRSFEKANKLFRHKLIDDLDKYYYRIDSLWKTCLMSGGARAEKYFMLDVDNDKYLYLVNIYCFCEKYNIKVIDCIDSPHGFHIITEPFDIRLINELKDVSVLKDGYIFVEMVERL